MDPYIYRKNELVLKLIWPKISPHINNQLWGNVVIMTCSSTKRGTC